MFEFGVSNKNYIQKKKFLQRSLITSAVKIFEFNFLIKTDGHTIVILEPELSKDFVHDVGGHSITTRTKFCPF